MMFEQVVLEGEHVRLEPLALTHRDGLVEAIMDGELWKLFVTSVPAVEELDGFYQKAEQDMASGKSLVFATIDKASGRVVGSTRFMNTLWAHQRLEIGFTFLAKSAQKTAVNTEAKKLMLTHAFETLAMNRVEFFDRLFKYSVA